MSARQPPTVARPPRRVLRRATVAGASCVVVLLVLGVGTHYGAAAVLWMLAALLLAGLLVVQWLAVRQLRVKRDAELADALAQSTWVTRWMYEQLRGMRRDASGRDQRSDGLDDD